MKKLIAVMLLVYCLFTVAIAEDLSSMTDAELSALYDSVRIEMLSRLAKAEKKTILVDDEDIQIYLTGSGENNSILGFRLEVVFMNKSDKTLGVAFDHIVINGWEVANYYKLDEIGAGKKSKDHITLQYEDAECETFKEMEDIELSFHTYTDGYKKVNEYNEISFNFDGGSWD